MASLVQLEQILPNGSARTLEAMAIAPSRPASAASGRDWPFTAIALACGALIGYAQVKLGELAISALLVAMVTMMLGAVRPRRPWRWALLVALCVPAAQLVAYLGREHFTRGATIGSFALLAPAFVCAYGGAVGRKLVDELFRK
jgi:hypothetical protein